MYLRAAKTEAEDAGISTEGMADSVSQLRDELMALTGGRVDIMSDAEAGSYKSTVEILRELSQVWDDLSDTSRTNITELIGGGVRNANIISALMNNFDIVDEAIETSVKSSGSALAENEKYLDSIEGKTAKFNAAFETMASTLVDSDVIKGVIDAGTALLEAGAFVGDKFGSAIALFAGGSIIDTISSLNTLVDKDSNLYKFFQATKSAGNDFKDMFGAIKIGASDFAGMAKEANSLKDVAAAFSKTSGNIWGSFSKGVKFAIAGLGIGALISTVKLANEYREKQIQLAQESAESYTESSKSISDYKDESLKLIKAIDAGVLSDEEKYESRSKLLEIERELTSTYGKNADGLNLLSQNATEAEKAFDSLASAQAKQYFDDNKGNIETATQEMLQFRTSNLGVFDWNKMSEGARSAVEKIVSEFDGVSLVDSAWGNKTLVATGDNANELLDVINQVNSAIVATGDHVNDHFSSNVSGAIGVVGKVVDTYGSQFEAGTQAAIEQSEEYTKIRSDIENAESSYTKSMSDSYDSVTDRMSAMADAGRELDSVIQTYADSRDAIARDNAGVADFFDTEIKDLQKQRNILDFGSEIMSATSGGDATERINGVSDALDKLRTASGELDSDFIKDIGLGLEDGVIDGDLEQAYVDLTEALSAYGLELQDVIPVMKAFGIMRKSTGEMLSDATKAYNSVLAEQQAVTNAYGSQTAGKSVSIETYESLISLSDEYTSCLEYENGAIQFNRQKLMELSKARAEENLQTIQANKMDAQKRYAENAEAIKKYQDSIRNATEAEADQVDLWEKEIKSLQDKNKEIENSIVKYALMAEAVENSMSAYSEWARAQSETQSGAWHASAASGLSQLGELYKNKEYGNTVLQEGLEFFTGANITGLDSWQARMVAIDAAYGQLDATISGTSYSLNDFMQSGKTGANNFLQAVSQLNGEWASFDSASQQWALNYNNADLAAALGTTEEFVVMMNELLELYGFEFEPSQMMTSEESMEKAVDLVGEYNKAVEDANQLELDGITGPEMDAAQAKVSDVASQLAALPRETLVSLGFKLEGVSDTDLVSAIQEQLPTINVPASQQSATETTGTANYDLGEYPTEVPDAQGKANYSIGDYPTKLPDATATVNYVIGSRPNIPGAGGSNVSGTFGPAKASGDIGRVPGGRTLVGELGREMFVDPATNTWHTIGDNGAEFVNLPKNAIVFNHRQTHSLLTSGKISARGKALVSGNAAVMVTREDPSLQKGSNPFLNKSGGPGLNGKPKQSGGGGGGSSSKSKSFEELYKEHQHLLKMEQETDKEYLEWLEKAYQEAYEKGEIELDDYNKYMEEVYELQKEVFQDSLNDIEHQISILERETGNESKIVEMYRGMMDQIQSEIQAAKDRGLDENSDYIQELQDKYYDYADEIKDIQEDLKDSAMDAVEDLIDFKTDMIKQDLEDEKDALNERLNDLKKFYDEQKKLLRDAHDEEKYLEEQGEKRKSVSSIQAEIAQLSLDNSAWAQKRKLELQEELLDAQKELDDFEKDHALDMAEDLLDKMYDKQAEQIESQIEAIDEKLNDPNALYNQALAAIQNNTAELYKEMLSYNNKHGDGNAETVTKMWDEAYESLKQYLNLFGEAYKDIVLVGESASISGYASGTRSATPGLHKLFEHGDEYVFKASDGTRYKMFSGGEKVLNARATNFLYDFAMSGGRILSGMLPSVIGAGFGKIGRKSQPIQLSTGNIIIEGNANERTVSEIRRAQREGIDYILKEFTRLNR